jgi:hypothetical protein
VPGRCGPRGLVSEVRAAACEHSVFSGSGHHDVCYPAGCPDVVPCSALARHGRASLRFDGRESRSGAPGCAPPRNGRASAGSTSRPAAGRGTSPTDNVQFDTREPACEYFFFRFGCSWPEARNRRSAHSPELRLIASPIAAAYDRLCARVVSVLGASLRPLWMSAAQLAVSPSRGAVQLPRHTHDCRAPRLASLNIHDPQSLCGALRAPIASFPGYV